VAADAAGISALIQSLLHHRSPNSIGPAPEEFVELFAPRAIEGYVEAGNYNYFVAMHLDQLVGVIGVRDNSQVVHLFVSESYQRRGIASALWSRARSEALTAAPEVKIFVRSSVFATRVYERFGFSACGPRVDDRGVSYVPMCQVIRKDD
jgi:GNAT superfamily N-acetyltransferase